MRGNETNAHLPFHSDSCESGRSAVPAPRQERGLSSIVSSVTLHNEVLRRHPEYLPPLYNGFHYFKREAALTDDPATPHRVPVFGAKDGYVSARLVRNQINAACVKTGKPLAPRERAAFDRSLRWQPRSPYQSTPVGDRAMRRCLRWLLRDHYDRIRSSRCGRSGIATADSGYRGAGRHAYRWPKLHGPNPNDRFTEGFPDAALI